MIFIKSSSCLGFGLDIISGAHGFFALVAGETCDQVAHNAAFRPGSCHGAAELRAHRTASILKKPEKDRGIPVSEYLGGQLCAFPSAAIPTSETRPARRYPVK